MATSSRRFPRWREFRQLFRFRRIQLSAKGRRLDRALNIWDLRTTAKRLVPLAVFDYTDGGAEQERSLAASRDAFSTVAFRPRVLMDVSAVSLTTPVLGSVSELPFGLAPTGFTRLMHHEGEVAVARTATKWGIPYALSTMGTTSIEDLAALTPLTRRWFQLYMMRDRRKTLELLNRAKNAGYEALILTVDVPVAGSRLRDVRNGFSIPPSLSAKTVLEGALHPRWWLNFISTPPLTFASLNSWDRTVGELIDELFDPSVTLEDLSWIRREWDGPIVVKGVQTAEDAIRVVSTGVEGIVVSNHGGRQMDRAVVPFIALPAIREVVPQSVEVWVDSGVMNGGDILACFASGANFVLVGRAYLYGLMAGGERGVNRSIEILSDEIRRGMQLLGVSRIEELNPNFLVKSSPHLSGGD